MDKGDWAAERVREISTAECFWHGPVPAPQLHVS